MLIQSSASVRMTRHFHRIQPPRKPDLYLVTTSEGLKRYEEKTPMFTFENEFSQ
jgi:hypothetical protein